ncbi:hypothetical protein GGI11_005536, partial [Coemansia sp. RSA 2049]
MEGQAREVQRSTAQCADFDDAKQKNGLLVVEWENKQPSARLGTSFMPVAEGGGGYDVLRWWFWFPCTARFLGLRRRLGRDPTAAIALSTRRAGIRTAPPGDKREGAFQSSSKTQQATEEGTSTGTRASTGRN